MLKKAMSLLLVCMLVACNLDSLTPAEKITYLEETGALPVLDRSDDLAGPDENNNGVRDDIEAYIEKTYTKPEQKAAAMQTARAFQKGVLVDAVDRSAVRRVKRDVSYAINCLYEAFERGRGGISPIEVSDELRSMTTNTKKRLLAYLDYNKALDGMSWALPRGNTCE